MSIVIKYQQREMPDQETTGIIWSSNVMKCRININSGSKRSVNARLAQSVERLTLNQVVVGSSPTVGDYFLIYFPATFNWIVNGILIIYRESQISMIVKIYIPLNFSNIDESIIIRNSNIQTVY